MNTNISRGLLLLSAVGIVMLITYTLSVKRSKDRVPQETYTALPAGFVYLADVAPSIRQDVRYAGANNFVGKPIRAYEKATVILTEQAAHALAATQEAIQQSSKGQWTLLVYDGYRPQQAVDHFWEWSEDVDDLLKKAEYYPAIADKTELFKQGYVARKSGHSRGSTVDLTIVRIEEDGSLSPLAMGSPFDLFDPISHYISDKISEEAKTNRKVLRDVMDAHGFAPYEEEWWHFTLRNEPFPDTYFDFPVK